MSRLAMVAVIGSLTAACSTEAMRFSDEPFQNPFKTASAPSDPVRTGSIDTPSRTTPLPRSSVRQERLAPVRTASLPQPRTAVAGGSGWSAAGGTDVTVGPGDTLASIASRYGVPPSAILAANGGMSASQVSPGRRIVIPVYSTSAESGRVVASSRIDVKKPAPRSVAEAAAPQTRTRPGRPVVAKAPEPERRVAEAKPAPKSSVRPEPKPVRVAKAPPATPVRQEPAKPKVAAVKPADVKAVPKPAQPAKTVAAQTVKPVVAPVQTKTAAVEPAKAPVREPEATGAIPAAPASAAPEFRWPARGRVITGFGGGGSSEGINISVPDGTPVKAAGDGVVAYAGSEVKGYGNLVLIRHDNGYVSAYAHNGDLDVKRGQKVARGQTIAKSGQSGNVTSPQLHFEIRKGSTPVDPMRYLASAN